jgi:IS605 OrfB family transposase
MIVTVTAKIRLYPSEEQITSLITTLSVIKQSLNAVAKIIYETRELRQPILHQVTYSMLRNDYGLRSQMAQSVAKSVISKYKSAKSNDHEWSLVNFKRPDYDLVWNRDYSFIKNILSVNSLGGRLKMNYSASGHETYFDGSWSFGTAKLVHKYGKFFLHVPISKDIETVSLSQVQNIVGIDLGIRQLAVSYNSAGQTSFINGSQVKQTRASYKKLRQDLQKKQTASSRKKLKKVGQRENRWMTDVNHRASKALVTAAGPQSLIVLEDLTGIRSATEQIRIKDRYLSVSWAFFQLRSMIDYKASLIGAKTIAVDPRYTSQSCPCCGHTSKTNRDKRLHLFTCQSCDYRSNDDRIGAMNLRQKGIEYIIAGTTE